MYERVWNPDIEPRSSLSYHRPSMERWRDGDGAMLHWPRTWWYDSSMVRQCDGDGAMTRWRWCDGMARWCDDDDAMLRQWDGNVAITRWRWCDSTMAMKRCSIAPLVSRHRTIVIASSHHRAIFFCTCAVSKRQMWIFIKHTNVKKGMFYHSFIPETLIFLAVMNAVTHSRKMERWNFMYVHIIRCFYYHDSVLVAFILKPNKHIDWNV